MRIPQTPPELSGLVPNPAEFDLAAFRQEAFQRLLIDARRRYWHWDKLRRVARARGIDPSFAWFSVRSARAWDARATPLRGHSGEAITYTVPDSVQHEQMLIDQQLAGRIGLDDGTPVDTEMRDRFVVTALMEEAIASSMLEGANTTVRVAKEMLRQDRRPRTRGERMVVNNYRAMRFVSEIRSSPLTPELLVEMQSMLTEGTLDREDQVGRLRNDEEDVRVEDRYGETLHTPPPAPELAQRINALCAFANAPDSDDDGHFMHPLTRAALLHFQIGFDHPFCDGNGRTARLVFYWSMLRRGYWLFEFLPISRLIYRSPGQYQRAYLYTESDDFDATYFLVYHARIVSQARKDLAEYISLKRAERVKARTVFAADPGFNHRQHAVLVHAIDHPHSSYTIEGHQNSHAVAYATARSDLLGLEQAGYLTRRTRGKRFEFTPSPRLLERANPSTPATEGTSRTHHSQ